MRSLTTIQQEAIERAASTGGVFYRWPFGEWRLYPPTTQPGSALAWALSYRVSTATINALRAAGYAVDNPDVFGQVKIVQNCQNKTCTQDSNV